MMDECSLHNSNILVVGYMYIYYSNHNKTYQIYKVNGHIKK